MAVVMTRREFVTAGAVAAAGIALAGPGCTPQRSEADQVETPSLAIEGGSEVSQRVLVGYATRTGSTIGVAEAIGKALATRGYDVDVRPLREHPSLEGYDAAVLGSAINGGAWLPEAVSYVQANRAALGTLPVAAYCVHIMNGGSEEKQVKRRLAYLDQLRAVVKPVAEGFFLGKGPTADDTSLIMRWAFRAFGGAGEGDCRDWEQIREWAEKAPV